MEERTVPIPDGSRLDICDDGSLGIYLPNGDYVALDSGAVDRSTTRIERIVHMLTS